MGQKSKFTFPMPGRPPKQAPPIPISNSLSKAEKILGTSRAAPASPIGGKDNGRSWETGSTSGISISISESSASQSGVLEGDEDQLVGTNYGNTTWEEESEVMPRRLRSAYSARWKSLKTKRSAITLGSKSRDTATEDSSRRPQSSSTAYSHYEPSKVPLSISQQTSSSAMAKGLPAKASALLDIDGTLTSKGQQRKKPVKLDFSKLRLRSRKDHIIDSNGVGPVLNNGYVMRSPSIMSHLSPSQHTILSPTAASPTSPGRTPRATDLHPHPMADTTRAERVKGTSDMSGLHQLYDHYEKMSFRHVTDLREEDEEDEDAAEVALAHSSSQRLPARTYEPEGLDASRDDTATPLPHSMASESDNRWTHSRTASQTSKTTTINRSTTPSTMQLRPLSRNDYPASVSSRHTRTSKATPSIMSNLDSDRQQQSVLSLTDSESDADETTYSRPGSSLPSYDNSSRDDVSISSSQRQLKTKRLSTSNSLKSTNSKATSYTQLNDFLTIPQASPKTKNGRAPSTNTTYSSNSSMSTATRVSLASRHDSSRASVSTTGTLGSTLSPTYSVQEARMISFTPLASTAEAASSVTLDTIPSNFNQVLSHQVRHRPSQNSHASDQPTPPLSPSSVEFFKRQSESTRPESIVSNASEPQNARLMAVTRQEEMLLAALRKKRARMRENIIAEIEEDRGGRGHGSKGSISGAESIKKGAVPNPKLAEKETRDARARTKQPKLTGRRSSSLVGYANPSGGTTTTSSRGRLRESSSGRRAVDAPRSTSHSAPTEKGLRPFRISLEPESRATTTTGKARHERVLLYLDRPIDSIDVVDQAEPSPDLSEFMDEELAFPMPKGQGRGRSASKLGGDSPEPRGRPRPDSSPVSPRSVPVQEAPLPNNLPKLAPAVNEEIHADADFGNAKPAVAHRRGAVAAREPSTEKGGSRSRSPASPENRFLTAPPPSAGHKKGKKSSVRLSAVGGVGSPIPWWGDDD
ncbi:hypothetical protein GGS23DRAFT_331191 [Durotheca rogersii]|uniref:uncharacterized protein n=1 Tax=Durotheca rogersii TaxID=419775 RepID=UPI00221F6157|nr:uncharacterized protein GGS23DRAFT_331191 [Durotheca rogersii]KAI5859315.1 hypothetical protein GGS23DRAFT_331191 [Durotheca rogersii]